MVSKDSERWGNNRYIVRSMGDGLVDLRPLSRAITNEKGERRRNIKLGKDPSRADEKRSGHETWKRRVHPPDALPAQSFLSSSANSSISTPNASSPTTCVTVFRPCRVLTVSVIGESVPFLMRISCCATPMVTVGALMRRQR